MKDEEYVFRQDVKEKSSTARSARNRRTHSGKGGRVKFPSDYMTRKELQSMNGEVKSYRLNEPMRYSEFKSMPDDVRVIYIQAIRQKYGVSDSQIAKMLGAAQTSFSKEVIRLGINLGRRCRNSVAFDKEAWIAWCNGITPIPVKDEFVDQVADEPEAEVQEEATEETAFVPVVESIKAIPTSGSMVFEGRVEDIMRSVETIIGGASVHISITWDVL